ncbi:MAG: BrnA antitoxin family protein [Gloeobacterales cyanobacterium]
MSNKDSSNTSHTNWAALEAMADEDIDYSDIPPLTDEFYEKATLRIPATQAHRLVQIDPDVLRWFQAHCEDYRASINSVLRRYIETRGEQPPIE